jgi:hypothetical protein
MADRAREDAEYEQRNGGSRRAVPQAFSGWRQPGRLPWNCAQPPGRPFCSTEISWTRICCGTAHYLAIDPIPGIGDPCANAGFFAAGHPPATTILERADAIAAHMGVSRQRAQRWAAIWTVLETCSAWREDQSDLEACLSSCKFEHLIRR